MDDQRRGELPVQRSRRLVGVHRHARARVTWRVAIAVIAFSLLACNNVDMRIGPGIGNVLTLDGRDFVRIG